MAYKLTLTHDIRRAIDWIGHRYFHGDTLWRLLWCQCSQDGPEDEHAEWDDPVPITFVVPESVAWQIADGIAEEDGFLPCFGPEACEVFREFLDSIV